jgi:hypothetical protein
MLTVMTDRQTAIMHVAIRVERSARWFADANNVAVYEIGVDRIRNWVSECAQPGVAPADVVATCNRIDDEGNFGRFRDAVIREVERGVGIRRGWWK